MTVTLWAVVPGDIQLTISPQIVPNDKRSSRGCSDGMPLIRSPFDAVLKRWGKRRGLKVHCPERKRGIES